MAVICPTVKGLGSSPDVYPVMANSADIDETSLNTKFCRNQKPVVGGTPGVPSGDSKLGPTPSHSSLSCSIRLKIHM